MRLQSVTSSNLDQVGYDPVNRQLIVVFKSGAAYRYDGVPGELYAALLRAESKGKFFIARVRKAFPFTRLDAQALSEAAPRLMPVQLDWRALECESAFF